MAMHSFQPIQLRENEDHKSFLNKGEKENYKFTINYEDETISKI